MPNGTCILLLLLSFFAISSAHAQGVCDHTRPTYTGGTTVTKSQAIDLTLTLSEAFKRPIQTWVRTARTIDKTGKILTAYLYPPDAGLMKVGQRVRTFPLDSKSSIYQAKITRVVTQADRVMVEANLGGKGRENSADYLMEIIVERDQFLPVPNEAIIEEEDIHIVYHYCPVKT